MTKKDHYGLALNAAREYRDVAAKAGSSHARCRQLLDDIMFFVGHTVGGKMRLPDAIRLEMGLNPPRAENSENSDRKPTR